MVSIQSHNFLSSDNRRFTRALLLLSSVLRHPSSVIALLVISFLVLAWPSLRLLAQIYATEDDYSHGFLVPFVTAYMAFAVWRQAQLSVLGHHLLDRQPVISNQQPHNWKYGRWFGLLAVVIGVLTVVLGQWYYIAMFPDGLGVGFLCATGLWLCIVGAAVSLTPDPSSLFLVPGSDSSKSSINNHKSTIAAYAFPLAYLLFAVPLPKNWTYPITTTLRDFVSTISEYVIRACGIIVLREGNILHLANGTLGVEDACSGIRSLWTLLAVAVAVGFFCQISIRRAMFLCVLTLPISVLMNSGRVIMTGILVSYGGMEFAEGWRHEAIGWVAFVGGLFAVLSAGQWLEARDRDQKTAVGGQRSADGGQGAKGEGQRIAVTGSGRREESGQRSEGEGLRTEHEGQRTEERNDSVARRVKQDERSGDNARWEGDALGWRGVLSAGVMASLFLAGTVFGYSVKDRYFTAFRGLAQQANPLRDFPTQIGDFDRSGTDGTILPEHERILQPSDYLVRYYRNHDGRQIELRILRWEPRRSISSDSLWATNAEYLGGGPHLPDLCFRGAGYNRLRQHDFDFAINSLVGAESAIRLFQKDGQNYFVLLWSRQEYLVTDTGKPLNTFANKVHTLVQSWHNPSAVLGNKFMINIIVPVRISVNDATQTAMKFVTTIRPYLPAYGIL